MRVEKTKIKNFRGIEAKELEFKPGFNLLVGENGKGKTSALEAIAVGLGGFVPGINSKATRRISTQEVRRTYPVLGDGSVDKKLHLPVDVEIEAVIDGEKCRWVRRRTSLTSDVTSTMQYAVSKKAEEMSQQEDTELPVILYESTERALKKKSGRVLNHSENNYYRSAGYDNALSGSPNVELLLEWCVKMEMVSWQHERKIAEYEAAKRAVALFMHEMELQGEYRISYDKQTGQLMLKTEKETFPVEDLSSGYQSLVWMVFDIAYRMAVLNPDKKDKITETSGVVLIDEIDQHLHPKWQWNIIDALRTVFPNVQFIAATHSPILFASAKNVWIIDMAEDDVTYSFSQYGLDVNHTLKKFQNTENVYPKVQEQILRFYMMVDKGDYSEAEKILNSLEGEMKSENPLITEMKTTLDLEMLELED